MNLKQFLKPDWGKIVIFVIIFIIAFLYSIISSPLLPCPLPNCPSSEWVKLPWKSCEICHPPTVSDYFDGIFYIIAFPTSLIEMNLGGNTSFLLPIILIIIQFFYFYLIACLIVWIYDKFRKQKKCIELKQFLKPDWRKIVLFIIISIALYLLSYEVCDVEACFKEQGYPIPIYAFHDYGTLGFLQFLLIDLIIWYLISCFIVWIYDKVKKK